MLFNGFAIAVRLSAPFGEADIVVMDLSVSRCAAFSAHAVFTVSADELSREYVVKDLFLAARRNFVFPIDCVHLVPDLLCDDGRKDVVISCSLMSDFSDISFVVQDDIDVFVVYMFSALAADVPRFQIFGDSDGFITLRIFHKYLTHDLRLGFVYDIFFIFNHITVRRITARGVAFEPTFAQTAVDFLFEVFLEIFVEPFDDGKEGLSFCRIRNSNIAADSFIIVAIIYAICKKIIVVPIIEFYGGLRIYISDLIFGMSLVNYHQR